MACQMRDFLSLYLSSKMKKLHAKILFKMTPATLFEGKRAEIMELSEVPRFVSASPKDTFGRFLKLGLISIDYFSRLSHFILLLWYV